MTSVTQATREPPTDPLAVPIAMPCSLHHEINSDIDSIKPSIFSFLNTHQLYDLTEDIELDTAIKYPILYGSREADSEKFTETVYTKLEEKLESGVIPRSQEQAFRDAIEEELRVFRKLNTLL